MERVFANLHRVNGSNSRGVSHTYFLKRTAGNALVSHQAPLGATTTATRSRPWAA